MTRDEFHQLRGAFERLKSASEDERARAIQALRDRDPILGGELQRMLDAHASATGPLDRPPVHSLAQDLAVPLQGRFLPGARFGPYRLQRELGRGGMGVVYEATRADGSFEKRVAIKILRPDRIDELFLRRFRQERQILAQLNHPHIAAILDAGTTEDGDPYFVMEYVEGTPITKYCKDHQATLSERLDLILQICDAVEEAHRNLTVHRDLKPGNILVTSAGAVKLLDFGIAKLLQSEPSDASEPATVTVLTPEYSSPEQIKQEPITTATDVFALGILMYEILSGVHPFRGSGKLPHEVMRALVADDPPPPSAVAVRDRAKLRGELDTIVMTALRKSPAWRYPSVAQLAADIGRYRSGWPVQARGNGAAYRFTKFARRQWLPLAAGSIIGIFLVVGVLATRQKARESEAARRNADFQRQAADESRNQALEQRRVAEARTKEAEAERAKEQERSRQLRSLTASLLFDLHDGIRDLAGSSTARKLIVAKAQQQLKVLGAEAGADIELQRDLAATYERMGELRVDPEQPAKARAAAALDSYGRAVALRHKVAAATSLISDRRDLALSLAKLGDGDVLAGDMKSAVVNYQQAWTLAGSLLRAKPRDPTLLRALGTIDERRCLGLLTAGDTAGAFGACQEGIDTLSPLAEASLNDVQVQRLLATTEASYANALRLSRRAPEAAQEARRALQSLERLETLAPSNAEYRRLSSSAGTILATSLAATGDNVGSIEAFRQSVHSMEVAVEIDPGDLGSALRLAVTLLAFSKRLAGAGDKTSAHSASQQALQLLDRAVDKPGAGPVEWNEYADALLKVDWPDLTRPDRALHLAQNAVAATKRSNPFFLDTLAWAFYRTGNPEKAAETERDALKLLPPNAKGGLKDELKRGLDTFSGSPGH